MTTPPSAQSQLVDPTGRPSAAWMRFFQDLAGPPAAIEIVPPSNTEIIYKATQQGFFVITGSTAAITGVSFTRTRKTISLPLGLLIYPMSMGDSVVIELNGTTDLSAVFMPS